MHCLYCYDGRGMARQPRVQLPGALYHVTSRGTDRRRIFVTDSDRQAFMKVLDEVADERSWRCYAYCLMNNHYHLLLQTPAPDLADGMKYLNGVYSQSFNARHNRVGHLMQGRYFSQLIRRESHLLAAIRYIVQNPVRAGLSRSAADWRWSSHIAVLGKRRKPDWLDVEFVLNQFASDPAEAVRAYAAFVEEVPCCERSIREVLYGSSGSSNGGVALSEIIGPDRDKATRNLAIFDAYENHGYRMREIAEYLGLHISSVSRIIKAVAGQNATQGV